MFILTKSCHACVQSSTKDTGAEGDDRHDKVVREDGPVGQPEVVEHSEHTGVDEEQEDGENRVNIHPDEK